MTLVEFCPFTHFLEVEALWERVLGASYPVSRRVLAPRLARSPTPANGEGVVAIAGGTVIGFGMAETSPGAALPAEAASLQVLLVDPAHQRRGVGTALLDHLVDRARITGRHRLSVGSGPERFWPGVPDDLPGAQAFLRARGFAEVGSCADLIAPVTGPERFADSRARLAAIGVTLAPAGAADCAAVVDFHAREFPRWLDERLRMIGAGDLGHILLAHHDGAVVGAVSTFTPGSRYRAANLVWERIHGASMGGLGAVGVAAPWRGRGLGVALSEAAIAHIHEAGGDCAYIDWTTRTALFTRIGARVCRVFRRVRRDL